MPLKYPCRKPGCLALIDQPGYCTPHDGWAKKLSDRDRNDRGDTASARGYDSAWRKARAAYLSRHPLCVRCACNGRTSLATVVDHITPHKGDKVLFWKKANWQSLCSTCHNRKTASEDGGFGNQSKAG